MRDRVRGGKFALSGFSLVELTVSMAIILVIGAAAFTSMIGYQKNYASTLNQADMHSGVRSAVELVTQEVGQAGMVPSNSAVLQAPVAASGIAQTVTVSSISGMYVGENLTVDEGTNQETVAVTALGASPPSISGVFTQNHAAGAPVVALGVFGQGVMTTSTANQLRLFGDINSDGTLQYVHYDCDYVNNQLTRSTTSISPSLPVSSNAGIALVQNLQLNPDGTPCFTYTSMTVNGRTYYTSVGLTITTQTSTRDPQTGQYILMTKSFLNLSPRNVVAAWELDTGNMTSRLQPAPAGLLTLQ